jgi:hypothetical protein
MYNHNENDGNSFSSKQSFEVRKPNIFVRNKLKFLSLKHLPVAEISMDSSEDTLFEESYPNMSINSSSISPINIPDNSLFEMMNDNPVDQSEDDEDESLFNFDWIKQLLIEEQHILEYSLEYGFLRLPPETRKRLHIDVLLVTLGNILFQYVELLKYLILFHKRCNK